MKYKLALLCTIALLASAPRLKADSYNSVSASAVFPSASDGSSQSFDVSFNWDTETDAIELGSLEDQTPYGPLTIIDFGASAMNLEDLSNPDVLFQIDFGNIGEGGSFNTIGSYGDANLDLSILHVGFWPRPLSGFLIVAPIDPPSDPPVNAPEPSDAVMMLLGFLTVFGVDYLIKRKF